MTTIHICYRPFSHSLTLWSDVDNTMTEEERGLLDCSYIDAPENGDWHIAIATRHTDGLNYFHSMTALDVFGCGAGWNLFLSNYLADEAIEEIYELVYLWDNMGTPSNLREAVLMRYMETVVVDGDCLIT